MATSEESIEMQTVNLDIAPSTSAIANEQHESHQPSQPTPISEDSVNFFVLLLKIKIKLIRLPRPALGREKLNKVIEKNGFTKMQLSKIALLRFSSKQKFISIHGLQLPVSNRFNVQTKLSACYCTPLT
jgi:hypothetical protein